MASALSVDDLRELSESWAVSLRAAGRTRETIRVYLRNVGQFLAFCERRELEPMARRALEAFIADLLERGREGMTARGRQTAVRQFARWLVDVEEIASDPFEGVKPPRIDTKVVVPLTDDQVRALLATCRTPKGATPERAFLDVRDEALLRLMVETGLRAGELLALTLDDVHWKGTRPTSPCNGRSPGAGATCRSRLSAPWRSAPTCGRDAGARWRTRQRSGSGPGTECSPMEGCTTPWSAEL